MFRSVRGVALFSASLLLGTLLGASSSAASGRGAEPQAAGQPFKVARPTPAHDPKKKIQGSRASRQTRAGHITRLSRSSTRTPARRRRLPVCPPAL